MMNDRVFSQEEVELLIKRAAKLDAEGADLLMRREERGLTLDELNNIAKETGLDPDHIEKAKSEMENSTHEQRIDVWVDGNEIISEIWLDCWPDTETIDMLISELNHIHGCSDDKNKWDSLLGTHYEKAELRRTALKTEWSYRSEMGMQSHRLLMKQSKDRFYLRLSNKQLYGMGWKHSMNTLYYQIPLSMLLGIICGVGSSELFGMKWPGITFGFLVSLAGFPFIRDWLNQYVEKLKAEVVNTMRRLIEMVEISENPLSGKVCETNPKMSATTIELRNKGAVLESSAGKESVS